jgi:chemotaxis protein MotB
MSQGTSRRRRTAQPGTRRHRHGHQAAGSHEEGAGAERWLVTYADMLTLLLVLFIVLFSISVVNTSKFISLKTSLAAAFGTGPPAALVGGNGLLDNSSNGTGQQLVMPGEPVQANTSNAHTDTEQAAAAAANGLTPEEVKNFKKIEKQIDAALRRGGLAGAAQFSIDHRGLVVTVVTDALVFPGNSATLLPKGRHILAVIAPPLRNLPNSIEVDGHTNQEKVSTYPYPTGWELSSARASSVVRYLISAGVAKSRLRAVGFSDQRPLVPPDDPRSITRNRRVDIVVLSARSAAASDDGN